MYVCMYIYIYIYICVVYQEATGGLGVDLILGVYMYVCMYIYIYIYVPGGYRGSGRGPHPGDAGRCEPQSGPPDVGLRGTSGCEDTLYSEFTVLVLILLSV